MRPPRKQKIGERRYCLPAVLREKHTEGWAEVCRLIRYRTFWTVGSPPDTCRINSCQLICLWLKWGHDVDRSHGRSNILADHSPQLHFFLSFGIFSLTRYFKDSCIWSPFASGARIAEVLCPRCQSAEQTLVHMFSICSFVEFSCGVVPH